MGPCSVAKTTASSSVNAKTSGLPGLRHDSATPERLILPRSRNTRRTGRGNRSRAEGSHPVSSVSRQPEFQSSPRCVALLLSELRSSRSLRPDRPVACGKTASEFLSCRPLRSVASPCVPSVCVSGVSQCLRSAFASSPVEPSSSRPSPRCVLAGALRNNKKVACERIRSSVSHRIAALGPMCCVVKSRVLVASVASSSRCVAPAARSGPRASWGTGQAGGSRLH